VTGDVFLIFTAKVFVVFTSTMFCLVKNHFSEVKKTTESFIYDLQQQ